MSDPDDLGAREQVAHVARMAAKAGLVEAFGHVSCRHGDGFLITSVAPMAVAGPDDVVAVDGSGAPVAGPTGRAPLETVMHAAIYQMRADVGGICRGHPRRVVDWGVGLMPLPLMHGLGAIAGIEVKINDDLELITTMRQAQGVARTLGGDHSVILRGNGALAVGSDPVEAAARLYFLEERARVATGATHLPVTEPEVWRRRSTHTALELVRAVEWFRTSYGDQQITET